MISQQEIEKVRKDLGIDVDKILETRSKIKELENELNEQLKLEEFLLSNCNHPNVPTRFEGGSRWALHCPYCITSYNI